MLLIRKASPATTSPLPADVVLRTPTPVDTIPLGRLYFESYEPGVACASEAEAIDDIGATFDGAYGTLSGDWSWLAVAGDQLVGALLVVERAPWPDTPDCPFIIELFVAPTHRRLGLARALLATVGTQSALRVAEDNVPARRLYESVGFQPG
ncbi:acetyltransferase (GNAT) family protein [Kribbella voronezhensis]|uniref:Acetyltransferase (GNAT) family protein n=1 Tax=Kribbella voronezhensis TaxID=2512212 RepID=A0A4R7T643_9ACTN|nr:GNAT family N-acetyltransferase [Kribbella voronezhensis]TDU87284.1 acetyltransferase (GNAT) family protein [Kribbella voronezhensis]